MEEIRWIQRFNSFLRAGELLRRIQKPPRRDGALQRNAPVMNEQYGLSEETINIIVAVFARHPEVERVILYGSRAKGSHRTGSNISREETT